MNKTLFEQISSFESPIDEKLVAIRFENQAITYQKMVKNIKKMASFLKDLGVKEKTVVTIALPNLPETIYLFYALDILGAIQNIIHPLMPIKKIKESMDLVNSKIAIVNEMFYQENKLEFSLSDKEFIFVNPMDSVSLLMRKMFYLKYPKARGFIHLREYLKSPEIEDITHFDSSRNSIYLHSGGTTGTSKVIALSDDAINNLALKTPYIMKNPVRGKGMLAVLPTFHGFGLGMGLHTPLANHATTCIEMKFDLKKTLKLIDKHFVHVIIGFPALYHKLLKTPEFYKIDLSALEECFIGGDNVSASLIEEFNTLLKNKGSIGQMLEGYGLTETVTVSSVNTILNHKEKSVGRSLYGLKTIVCDEELNILPNGTVGELYISGDTLMNEYVNDHDNTSKTLVKINGETFVKTGDLGFIDEDGYIFLKGRKKRMFKIAGYNVYPLEVEKIAMNHEEIKIAALEFFDTPKAHTNLYVVRRASLKTDEEIRKILYLDFENNLLKYSIPSKIIFMEHLPETSVGKIDHFALKDE